MQKCQFFLLGKSSGKGRETDVRKLASAALAPSNLESLAMVWSGMLVIVSPGAMAFLKSAACFFAPPILLLQQARATCILARDKDKRL